jgi:Protein of unknown function (DUF4054)
MAITLTSKAPGERIAYLWTPALAIGDTITGSPTVALVSGTANTDGVSLVGTTQVKIFLISGDDGDNAEFLATVNTTGGETLQETFYLPVNVTAYGPLGSLLAQLFPAFASVPTATIDYWLSRAGVEASWADEHGQMLYAAHNLSLTGFGEGSIPSGVTSFKSGTFSATIADSIAGGTGWDATVYGREYKRLLRQNVATPFLVSGAYV